MGELAERIAAIVSEECARELVAAFYDPHKGFAGTTFDDLPDNRPERFTTNDLLAVSLLDVALLPAAVRTILAPESGSMSERLRAVPVDVDLWNADDEHLQRVQLLWDTLTGLPGVGATRKSKLLARKRPRLIPIVDTVIRQALPLGDNSWFALRGALSEEPLRRSIEALRPPGVGPRVSTLRLLDTVVWMRFSEGRGARNVRKGLGLSLADLPPRRR